SPQNRACKLAPHTAQVNHLPHKGSRSLAGPRMVLLVAVQVYQFPIAGCVRTTCSLRLNVVTVQLLAIDEGHATQAADPIRGLGQLHITGGQVADVDFPPGPPVLPQTGVVGRSRTAYQDVALDGEPGELQQVPSRALVAKHPGIVPCWV